MPGARTFLDVVRTEGELRGLLGEPGGVAVGKQLDHLDRHCRSFVAPSPFVLVGTVGPGEACDASPRGDGPGFVPVLDGKTLAIPERPGNRRLNSLLNILETGTVGLLFVVPGFEETLRVNGRATVVRDADVLGRTAARGKTPTVAIGVEVEECLLPPLRQGVQALGALAGEAVAGALHVAVTGTDLPRPGGRAGDERARPGPQDRGELRQATVLRTAPP